MSWPPPPRGTHPSDQIAAAVRGLGEREAVAWLCALASGGERPGDPAVEAIGGTSDWAPYWHRTWGLRGLLYAWDERATPAVVAALGDEHWRPREMAAKVCRARLLEPALPALEALRDDPNERVQRAAARAVAAIAGQA